MATAAPEGRTVTSRIPKASWRGNITAGGRYRDGMSTGEAVAARPAGGTSLAELGERQVRVVSAPLATVTELAIEAAAGLDLGSPSPWVAAVRAALHPADLAVLGPCFGPGTPPFVPDAVLPVPGAHSVGFDEELERALDEAATGLVAEIHLHGLADRPPWSTVARSPRRWAEAHLAAVRRAWHAVEHLWHRAAPLREREVERVGAALASGSLPHLLDGLSRKGHVAGDHWYPRPGADPAVLLPGLVLQPMVIGPRARLTAGDGGVGYIAYPLPGVARLGTARPNGADGPPPAQATPLGALLGEPRAEILRRVDRPTPAGRLATDLLFTPSAITHHVNALARAGLVTRHRQGRQVLVTRSPRGSTLLHLYEP